MRPPIPPNAREPRPTMNQIPIPPEPSGAAPALPGRFIVFEGLDGSGTSTQARLLHEALLREGQQVFLTAEPTNGPVGNLIRLAMNHRLHFSDDTEVEDRQLAHLFAADRHDHLYNSVNGVLALLQRDATVISTRYYLSSYAYHCNSPWDVDLVRRLNADFPPPHVTFFIDCPVDVCLARIAGSRTNAEKYETENKLRLVRRHYEEAMQAFPGTIHRIDGSRPQEEIHALVLAALRENG